MNMRKYFPHLNEFASTVSNEIIKWMNDYNLQSHRTYEDIFACSDIEDLIDTCPDIEFMVEGIRQVFGNSEHFNDTIMYMANITSACCTVRHNMQLSQRRNIKTIAQFMSYGSIDKLARARVLLWELSQLMYTARGTMYNTEMSFSDIRRLIVRLITNTEGYDYTYRCNNMTVNDYLLAARGAGRDKIL